MAAIIAQIAGGTLIGGTVGSVTAPILRPSVQTTEQILQNNIPDPSALIQQAIRGVIPTEHYLELMSKYGYNKAQAERMRIANFSLLGLSELITLFRRKALDFNNYLSRATHIGFTKEEAERALKASEIYQTPQDLIRFLVREVYTETIRKRFQLDAEFPANAIPKGAEIGVSESLMKDYWAAHWELPAFTAVQNMLYRFSPSDRAQWESEMKEAGVDVKELETDLDLVRLLFKTQDVMPFWRERFVGISYQTLTRVDVRRMIRLKLLDYQQALYQFKKEGYTPTDAKRLTWFSFIFESLPDWQQQFKDTQITTDEIKREMSEWQIPAGIQQDIIKRKLLPLADNQVSDEKQIVKGEIKKALELGFVNRLEVLDLLKKLNYTEPNAKFIFEVWDAEIQRKKIQERDLSVTDQATLYELGSIPRSELMVRLQKLGLDKIEVEDKMFLIDAKIAAKKLRTEQGETQRNKDLSFTDQKKLFLGGFIGETEFKSRLLKMGYDAKEAQEKIALTIQEFIEKQEKAKSA
jgi:hypothetical protein